MREGQATTTTGGSALKLRRLWGTFVSKSLFDSGGGSEVFATVLLFVDTMKNAPDCFVCFFRVGPWGQSQGIRIQLSSLHEEKTTTKLNSVG